MTLISTILFCPPRKSQVFTAKFKKTQMDTKIRKLYISDFKMETVYTLKKTKQTTENTYASFLHRCTEPSDSVQSHNRSNEWLKQLPKSVAPNEDNKCQTTSPPPAPHPEKQNAHIHTRLDTKFVLTVNQIQTHKRFTRMLLITTKHNTQIFRVIPFIKLQNDT